MAADAAFVPLESDCPLLLILAPPRTRTSPPSAFPRRPERAQDALQCVWRAVAEELQPRLKRRPSSLRVLWRLPAPALSVRSGGRSPFACARGWLDYEAPSWQPNREWLALLLHLTTQAPSGISLKCRAAPRPPSMRQLECAHSPPPTLPGMTCRRCDMFRPSRACAIYRHHAGPAVLMNHDGHGQLDLLEKVSISNLRIVSVNRPKDS